MALARHGSIGNTQTSPVLSENMIEPPCRNGATIQWISSIAQRTLGTYLVAPRLSTPFQLALIDLIASYSVC